MTTARRAPWCRASGGSSRTSRRALAPAGLGDGGRHRVRFLELRHVTRLVEYLQTRTGNGRRPCLAAGRDRRETIVGAPAEQRGRRDAAEPPAQERIVEIRIPGHPGES